MNNETNDLTNADLQTVARGAVSTDRAVAGIMLAVRDARLDTAAAPTRRWDHALAWTFAAAGLFVLCGTLGQEWFASSDHSYASPRSIITDSAALYAQHPTATALPSDLQIAMTNERGAMLEGAQAVHINRPMRLSVVNGALRVESHSGITPPGR